MAETTNDEHASESPEDPPQQPRTAVSGVMTVPADGGSRPRRPSAEDLLANARPTRLPYSERKNEHKLQRRVEEHELRKKVAKWSYIGLATQIGIADGAFVAYAWVGRDWNLPVAAISAWLSATVVQVIAVLLVITRYLFPDRGKRPQ